MAEARKKAGQDRPKGIGGQWEGKLLDVGGQSARIVLDLDQSGKTLGGDFSVYVESERDGCCGGGWRLAQVAPVAGSFDEGAGTLRLKYGLKLGRAPVEVAFSARIVDADPHAIAAMVGTYDVADKATQVGLEGGACVLWRYRQ